MARLLEEIERDILALDSNDKNEILKLLILDLDSDKNQDVEKQWLKEVQTRYSELLSGKVKAIPLDEVMNAARQNLLK